MENWQKLAQDTTLIWSFPTSTKPIIVNATWSRVETHGLPRFRKCKHYMERVQENSAFHNCGSHDVLIRQVFILPVLDNRCEMCWEHFRKICALKLTQKSFKITTIDNDNCYSCVRLLHAVTWANMEHYPSVYQHQHWHSAGLNAAEAAMLYHHGNRHNFSISSKNWMTRTLSQVKRLVTTFNILKYFASISGSLWTSHTYYRCI